MVKQLSPLKGLAHCIVKQISFFIVILCIYIILSQHKISLKVIGRLRKVVYHYTYPNTKYHRTTRTSRLGGMWWDEMGWSGVEWGGVGWSGVGWSGVGWGEWGGVEWGGVEWGGVEWGGVEWGGVGWGGLGWSGVGWIGVEWSGVEWGGVEWGGVEWSGVEWGGVEWGGVEWERNDAIITFRFLSDTSNCCMLEKHFKVLFTTATIFSVTLRSDSNTYYRIIQNIWYHPSPSSSYYT